MRYTVAFLASFVASAIAAPTATVFPTPASKTALAQPKVVSGTFDGKMVRFSRTSMFRVLPSHIFFAFHTNQYN